MSSFGCVSAFNGHVHVISSFGCVSAFNGHVHVMSSFGCVSAFKLDMFTLCILSAVCLHLNTANKLTCSFVKIGERNRENTEQIKKKRKQSKQAKPHVALFSEPNYTVNETKPGTIYFF